MLSAFDLRDERQSLTARERECLETFARGAMTYNARRSWPSEWRTLLSQGLIFHSFNLISITPKGEEVLDRVG